MTKFVNAPMGEGKADLISRVANRSDLMAFEQEFVEYYMGTRCPECEPECPACKAWAAVDHLDRLVQEMTDEFIGGEIKELGNIPNKTDSKGETK